ncbi:MAG: response regulator [Sulfuricurvum sp.]|nr:response regulator [Sulfuricurvum sp.]
MNNPSSYNPLYDLYKEYLGDMTLLCVEDDKFSQMLYPLLFEDIVSKVIVANDGEEGYEQYQKNHVDIIITDYHMPRLDGLEMIRKIRLENPFIPIILVTAIDISDVIIEALKLHVSNFIRKPIDTEEVFEAVVMAAKIVIGERYIEAERSKKIHELQEKERYSLYQEQIAFDKELAILRNDFYYQRLECECCSDESVLIPDFIYRPLDILSGDAYSARMIDNHRTLYLLVDGMGKGVSASLSAMLMTAHINYSIDIMLENKQFDLRDLISDAMNYIRPILLDDEMLSIDFIVIDQNENKMEYAKFAMPPSLLQNLSKKITKLKSNNPPMNKYIRTFEIAQIDISSIIKFLFCTDGVVENTLKGGKGIYADHLDEDFLNSYTKEELKKYFFERIDVQEDDVTFIFINCFAFENKMLYHRHFTTALSALDEAGSWYELLWKKNVPDDMTMIANAQIVFTELMMNAYEHGNLGIGSQAKHELIAKDSYIDILMEREIYCVKQIDVKIYLIEKETNRYLVTQITDEGAGFDTKTLSKIFRNTAQYNGKGVYLSRQASMGLYYNKVGNSVMFLHKIS